MWTMVVRMLAVFAFWGAALAGAVAGGLPPRSAELTAAAFAGLTLAVMGLRPARAPDAKHLDDLGAADDERRSVS